MAAKLTHLNHLVLKNTQLPVDQSDAIWRVCARLETLTLVNCLLPLKGLPGLAVPPGGFPRLRRLLVDLPPCEQDEDQFNGLLQHSPRLETLKWTTFDFATTGTARVTEAAVQATWPKLKELELNNQCSDEKIALILNNMQEAVKLGFAVSGFGIRAFETLRGHFGTLTSLDIMRCEGTTSIMVREILCSCKLLTSLCADRIFAEDVVEGRPWVCLSLRLLNLHFLFNEDQEQLNQPVLERLSSLVQLEELYLNDSSWYGDCSTITPLDFGLHSGLRVLSSLRRLRRLRLKGAAEMKQYLGAEEAEWMAENWRRLEKVELRGYGLVLEATRVLESYDIIVVW